LSCPEQILAEVVLKALFQLHAIFHFGGGADGHRSNAGESRIAASRSIQHEKTSSLCPLRWCGAPSLLALAKATNKALHPSGVTELVGREEELELLLRRWSKAKSGEGQVVLLSGEPGIGKPKFAGVIPIKLTGYQRACHARGKHTGNELTGGAKRRGPLCAEALAHRHVSANSSV
jgi:hypothetical protein